MKSSDIKLHNNYYTTKVSDDSILIYNSFYNTKKSIFVLYLILEFIGSPGFDLLRIPRKYIVCKNASFINLSKNLKLDTDGSYNIIFEKQEVIRWFIGVVIPIFIVSVIFLFTLYPAINFMNSSNMSTESIVLFTVLLIVTIFLLFIDVILIKNYREYKKDNNHR